MGGTGGTVEDVLWAAWSASALADRLADESAAGGSKGAVADRALDAVIALFDAHGLSVKVAQWTNELQTAIGLVGAGMGVTLVPASVQVLHRADIGYTPVVEATASSPVS